MKINRTKEFVEAYCEVLTDWGINYKIRHGSYTTTIIHERGKKTFSNMDFSRKTFIAANKVKSDVLASDFYLQIKDAKFERQNYDFNPKIKSITGTNIYNIDISKAYANCLLTHGLISSSTFEYLNDLPKGERLVCVGMLARSYTEFIYKDGDLVDIDFHREPTSNAFFFLIHEITQVMKECQFYLGKHFIFYWVDGIFFDDSTPKHIIRKVEQVLEFYGYPYKYERIDFFDYVYKDEEKKIVVNMVKNGENKTYNWGTDLDYEEIKENLHKDVKKGKRNKKQDKSSTLH